MTRFGLAVLAGMMLAAPAGAVTRLEGAGGPSEGAPLLAGLGARPAMEAEPLPLHRTPLPPMWLQMAPPAKASVLRAGPPDLSLPGRAPVDLSSRGPARLVPRVAEVPSPATLPLLASAVGFLALCTCSQRRRLPLLHSRAAPAG